MLRPFFRWRIGNLISSGRHGTPISTDLLFHGVHDRPAKYSRRSETSEHMESFTDSPKRIDAGLFSLGSAKNHVMILSGFPSLAFPVCIFFRCNLCKRVHALRWPKVIASNDRPSQGLFIIYQRTIIENPTLCIFWSASKVGVLKVTKWSKPENSP